MQSDRSWQIPRQRSVTGAGFLTSSGRPLFLHPVKRSEVRQSHKLGLPRDPRSRDFDDVLWGYLVRPCGPLHFFGVVDHNAPKPFTIAQDDIHNLIAHPRLRQAAQVIHPPFIKVQSHTHLSAMDCGPDAVPAGKSALNSTSTPPPDWSNFGTAVPQ